MGVVWFSWAWLLGASWAGGVWRGRGRGVGAKRLLYSVDTV